MVPFFVTKSVTSIILSILEFTKYYECKVKSKNFKNIYF